MIEIELTGVIPRCHGVSHNAFQISICAFSFYIMKYWGVLKKQRFATLALHKWKHRALAHVDSAGYEFSALDTCSTAAQSRTGSLVETLVATSAAVAAGSFRHTGAVAVGAAVPLGHRGGHHLSAI
ncbi:hypothetical protein [Hydrogenophaga sp.]|uniref:hypothetical protein n=1 Tax=Hydrogenophaga sp. TaxID=1904254 RepID=UPI002FC96C68